LVTPKWPMMGHRARYLRTPSPHLREASVSEGVRPDHASSYKAAGRVRGRGRPSGQRQGRRGREGGRGSWKASSALLLDKLGQDSFEM
jgi:hypothetical protein